ncbi:MAG TPA: BON domain-containing protein [Polyangiaceae bacterium]|nr:BON domain-containing protein [Polyangiaceae bacterium]
MSVPKSAAAYNASAQPSAPRADSNQFTAVPAVDAPTDLQIGDAVLRQLERDPGVDTHDIQVVTVDGIVQLSGTVDDLLSKERIARVAETVRGVRAVSNLVRLNVPKRDDRMIASDVSNALHLNAATESLRIVPTSYGGTVTLMGTVSSWQEKQLAERITKGVRGVTGIEDHIDVKYSTSRSDPQMATDVESRLMWDMLVDDDRISATVEGGKVFLRGQVGSAAERSRAYADAWVTGVQSVDVSELVVNPSMRNPDVRLPSEVHPSDPDIAQAIMDAAVYDPRVSSTEIRPEVVAGIVTLRGIVDDLQAKLAAESIARHTVGVVDVRDRIQVKSQQPVTDQQKAERIRDALAIDPVTDDDDVRVDVDNGVAVLRGAVGTYLESAEATQLAAGVRGISSVDNQLNVKRPGAGYRGSASMYDPYVESWTYIPRKVIHSDAKIARDIENELASTPFVDENAISVQVRGGTATLTGTVSNWKQRSAASRDAFAGGAVAVDNELQVK